MINGRGDVAILNAAGDILDTHHDMLRPPRDEYDGSDLDWKDLSEEQTSELIDRQCAESWVLGKRLAKEWTPPLQLRGLADIDALFSSVLERFHLHLQQPAFIGESKILGQAVNPTMVWDAIYEGLGDGVLSCLSGGNPDVQ